MEDGNKGDDWTKGGIRMMKLYFWLTSLFIGATLVMDIFTFHIANIHTFLVDFFQIISIIGLYGYVFKKEIGKRIFWKIFSFFYLLWYIGDGLYIVSEIIYRNLAEAIFVLVFGLVFSIPLFIGLFKYGINKAKA